MTCEQFDNLRNGPGGAPAPPTAAAQEHLASCARCRGLQDFLHAPLPPAEVDSQVQDRITGRIVASLRPVSALPSDAVLMTELMACAAAAIAAGAFSLGQSGWHALSGFQATVVFVSLSVAMLSVAHVVTRQMVPGSKQHISVPRAAAEIFIFLFVAIFLIFPYQSDPQFVSTGVKCWERGVMAGAFAALLFTPVLLRGAWLSPAKLAGASGLLAGLAGLTVLEIYCPYLNSGHIGFWHLGAAVASALAGSLIGAAGSALRRR